MYPALLYVYMFMERDYTMSLIPISKEATLESDAFTFQLRYGL